MCHGGDEQICNSGNSNRVSCPLASGASTTLGQLSDPGAMFRHTAPGDLSAAIVSSNGSTDALLGTFEKSSITLLAFQERKVNHVQSLDCRAFIEDMPNAINDIQALFAFKPTLLTIKAAVIKF